MSFYLSTNLPDESQSSYYEARKRNVQNDPSFGGLGCNPRGKRDSGSIAERKNSAEEKFERIMLRQSHLIEWRATFCASLEAVSVSF